MAKLSKRSMREENERLVREAMAKQFVAIQHVDSRIEATCGKCGAKNRVSVAKGEVRPSFTCKECGLEQKTL
jgi:transposase-like protein